MRGGEIGLFFLSEGFLFLVLLKEIIQSRDTDKEQTRNRQGTPEKDWNG